MSACRAMAVVLPLSLSLTQAICALPAPLDAERPGSRDPFQPLTVTPCNDAQAAQWRLRGVMGDGVRWVGWLATPHSSWLKVEAGDVVPQTPWRIAALNQYEIRMMKSAAASGCEAVATERVLPAPGAVKGTTDKGRE